MIKLFRQIIILLLLFSGSAEAQLGGKSTFQFLNLVTSARAAGLGGNDIATRADDVTIALQNPSQLQASMHQQLSMSYVGYMSGIRFGDVIYAHHFQKWGTFSGNIHFVNYGSTPRTDETGTVIGSFKAAEYAYGISYCKVLDSNLFLGAALRGVFSNFDGNKSNGVVADIGLTYIVPAKLICATLLVKNAGKQLKKYDNEEAAPLPFEIQAGISKQLAKAPFRFSLIGQQLQKFDLSYKDPNLNGTDPLTGEVKTQKITFADKIMRHAIINAEILFTKSFNVRVGYNYMRRKELALTDKKGLSGMSFGFGFRINRFHLSYAYSVYIPSQASSNFTISTNLNRF